MPALTDRELWLRVRREEVGAFGELYERHIRRVHAYCLGRTAATLLADEVASTTFLEAWRRRRRLRLSTASAAPPLLGVATEVLRDNWRPRRRHSRPLARINAVDLPPWDEDELVARVDAISAVREAGAEIRTLPPREREVLALLVWGRLSYPETAAALGIPVGTVRSRVRPTVTVEVPDVSVLSVLLPGDSTITARRMALETSCGGFTRRRGRQAPLRLGGRRGRS